LFERKHIVLGVTGGIAAYKSCLLARELMKRGAEVRVVMTPAATRFVTPLTFSALTGYETAFDLWKENQSGSGIRTEHISLAHWADIIVVAPATATTLAKMAYGIADNLLTAILLATSKPVVVAPAMDADMFRHPATKMNLKTLRERGVHIIDPESGALASGLEGPGRLPEVAVIVGELEKVMAKNLGDLADVTLLVTAGPTHEAIDPVRFIGNRSSGKMGFAIAAAAAARDANVKLVSGPVSLPTPPGVERIDVTTAAEMSDVVQRIYTKCDAVIMAAAVADFKPKRPANAKLKKNERQKTTTLDLEHTVDILAELGKKKKKQILVGFALETDTGIEQAKEKLKKKNLDLIVLNSMKDKGAGFGGDTNVITIIDRGGKIEKLPLMSKTEAAGKLLDRLSPLLSRKR
jgi:phosphopantothenoylcysteine decarboxylase/phosphopantothenate--cysteine ligase